MTAVFMVAEAVGGIVSGSLALLADAGHMFTDVAALALSVFAMRLSRRPPSTKRTYGYARLEILAALVNGAALLVIAGLIVVEAWERFSSPSEVNGGLMLTVAVGGLLVNVVGAMLLHDHAHAFLGGSRHRRAGDEHARHVRLHRLFVQPRLAIRILQIDA